MRLHSNTVALTTESLKRLSVTNRRVEERGYLDTTPPMARVYQDDGENMYTRPQWHMIVSPDSVGGTEEDDTYKVRVFAGMIHYDSRPVATCPTDSGGPAVGLDITKYTDVNVTPLTLETTAYICWVNNDPIATPAGQVVFFKDFTDMTARIVNFPYVEILGTVLRTADELCGLVIKQWKFDTIEASKSPVPMPFDIRRKPDVIASITETPQPESSIVLQVFFPTASRVTLATLPVWRRFGSDICVDTTQIVNMAGEWFDLVGITQSDSEIWIYIDHPTTGDVANWPIAPSATYCKVKFANTEPSSNYRTTCARQLIAIKYGDAWRQTFHGYIVDDFVMLDSETAGATGAYGGTGPTLKVTSISRNAQTNSAGALQIHGAESAYEFSFPQMIYSGEDDNTHTVHWHFATTWEYDPLDPGDCGAGFGDFFTEFALGVQQSPPEPGTPFLYLSYTANNRTLTEADGCLNIGASSGGSGQGGYCSVDMNDWLPEIYHTELNFALGEVGQGGQNTDHDWRYWVQGGIGSAFEADLVTCFAQSIGYGVEPQPSSPPVALEIDLANETIWTRGTGEVDAHRTIDWSSKTLIALNDNATPAEQIKLNWDAQNLMGKAGTSWSVDADVYFDVLNTTATSGTGVTTGGALRVTGGAVILAGIHVRAGAADYAILVDEGDLDVNTGHVRVWTGDIYCSNGDLYTESGALYSESGDLYTVSGEIYSTIGNIYATDGNIYSTKGNLYATEGDVYSTLGDLYTTQGNIKLKDSSFAYYVGDHPGAGTGEMVSIVKSSDGTEMVLYLRKGLLCAD